MTFMKRDKITYKYDEEICDFVPVRKNTQYYLQRILIYGSLTCIVAAGAIVLFYSLYDSPRTERLRRQNEQVQARIQANEAHLAAFRQDLDSLDQKEKALYRTSLNSEPIDQQEPQQAERQQRWSELNESSVEELEDELEQLNKKLTKNNQATAIILTLASMKKEELEKIPSIRPVHGEIISGFGVRKNPIIKKDKMHKGIDFKADVGTPVEATADGRVIQSGIVKNGMGKFIAIRHANGYVTKYAHLSKIGVRQGQRVQRGDTIGQSGMSGLCKGPHMHYRLYKDGKAINPIDYFYTDLSPEAFIRFKKKANRYNESMN